MPHEPIDVPPSERPSRRPSGATTPLPPQRQVSRIRRRKYQVRRSLLTHLFFPHYAHRAMDDEDGEKEKEDEEPTIFEKVVYFLQSRPIQIIGLVLLALDVVLVISEIIILTHEKCHLTPSLHWGNATQQAHCHHAELSSVGGSLYVLDTSPCAVHATTHLSHTLHDVETVLKWCSRSILFIFAAELIALVVCLRLSFFKNLMYVLDVVIIGGSIILEFTVRTNDADVSPMLIIFVRCWRFCRIIHGVGLGVHEYDEIEMEEEHDAPSPAPEGGPAAEGAVLSPEGSAVPRRQRSVIKYRVIRTRVETRDLVDGEY